MSARGRPPCDHRRLAGGRSASLYARVQSAYRLKAGRDPPPSMAMVGRSGRVHRRARPYQGAYDVGVRVGTAPTARSRSSNSCDVAYVARWSASGSSLRASRVTGHRRANPCTHMVDLDRDLRPTPASPAIPGDLIRVHASVSGGTALSTSPSRRCPRLAIANVTEITATARVLYSAYKLS